MSILRVLKSRIVEAACRTDFMTFFQSAFHVLEPGSTLNLNWHHHAIAYYLELVRRGKIKRLIIVAPPRTLKSLMASVAFPVYALGRDPTTRIIGISHSPDLQLKFSNDCRALISNPHIQRLFPELELAKNTETEFHTTQGGYRYAKSAESVTGFGGDILILDDFQTPTDVFSEARRNSTNSLYYRTIASRINNQHSAAIVMVGQRLYPDDLIGIMLRSPEPWTVLCLPAIAEKEEAIPIGPGRCHVRKIDELLHPQQLSREYLESLRFQDNEIYLAQYQQSPIPPGGFIIKREQIRYCDQLPKSNSSSAYLQSWDTARKPGDANSRSACLDVLVDENKYFIAHALVGQWDYDELERRALWRASEGKPNAILVEDDGGFGTVLIGALKRKGLPVIAVKPEGDKKSRLVKQMDKFANGQVFLLKSAPGRAEIETELLSFPAGQRNDLVDALTQALGYKHVRCLWTDEALENYNKLLWTLAASAPRRRFPY
jgi:predicted phage terminase large subunit-like protein